MHCFDLVDRMVTPNARVPLEPNYDRHKVTLTEPACADAQATIFNVPERAIVVRLDESLTLQRVFRGDLGECKRSDFLILAERGPSLVIVHVEMKRAGGKHAEVVRQLEGSRCFVLYMQALGKAFSSHKTFLDDARHRFVSIRHARPQKRKTKITRAGATHDRPDRPMIVSGPNYVHFDKIAGGN